MYLILVIGPVSSAIATILLTIANNPLVQGSVLAYSSIAIFFFNRKNQQNLNTNLEAEYKKQLKDLSEKREFERQEAELVYQREQTKANFTIKIAYEVQTLLSMINTTVNDLKNTETNSIDTVLVQSIKRNSSLAIKLISQIHQIHQLDNQKIVLNLKKSDLVTSIRELTLPISDLSAQKKIRFLFESEYQALVTRFDDVMIERILFNLLYHTLTHTNPGGQISVLLDVKKDEQEVEDVAEIKIIYKNPEPLTRKFKENINTDNLLTLSLLDEDNLSLSIAQELSTIHKGQITVEREDNHGFTFTLLLPIQIETKKAGLKTEEEERKKNEATKENSSHITGRKPLILLIEDNTEMREYLHDSLSQHFSIVEAANGKEGWQKTLALHPTLVISDVDMPEMNGIDLCKKIKSDKRTGHIPVILLTALGDEYNEIAGLEGGANDYIVKPFNTKILISKIDNLLTLKDTLKKTYQKQVDIQSKEMTIESEDDKFVAKLIAVAEKNLSNPNFSVEEFSSIMAMSRVALYKKILSITGKTPVEFIRTMRLQKAIQLLKKSRLPIARVAYEVGYSNPNYFAKIFKEEYKMLPSEYLTAEKEGGV